MYVNIEIKSDKYWVYRAMLATQRKKPKPDGTLKDASWFHMLRDKHSCIEEFELWIDAIVPETVHKHIVRHKEIGKYVATSRPDLKHGTPLQEGMRSLSLRINAKRMIEIAEQRRCEDSWSETVDFVNEIVKNIPDKTLKAFCTPKCVRCNWCIGSADCGYILTDEFKKDRKFFETGTK